MANQSKEENGGKSDGPDVVKDSEEHNVGSFEARGDGEIQGGDDGNFVWETCSITLSGNGVRIPEE